MTHKPCPFCGTNNGMSVTYKLDTTDFRLFTYYVQCSKCKAVGPTAHAKDDAVKFWNSRGNLTKALAEATAEANLAYVTARIQADTIASTKKKKKKR